MAKSPEPKQDAPAAKDGSTVQSVTPAPVNDGGWDEAAMKQAEEYGVSPEEAVSLGEPDKVLRLLGSQHKKLSSKSEHKPEPEKKAKALNIEAIRLEFGDDVAEAMGSMTSSVGELRAMLDEMRSEQKRRSEDEESQASARANELIDDLGDAYSDLFADSSRASPLNRKRVRDEMRAIADQYRTRGRRVPSEKDRLRMALIALWPEHSEKSASRPTTTATTIHAPSHLNGASDASPKETGMAFIRQYKAAHGY